MTASGEFDARPVRAFLPGPDLRVDESAWPASVPAMSQVLRQGLELPAGLTVLVGENGSGKSTVVEALAGVYGLNPQGGSALGRSFRIRPSEPGVGGKLTVVRGSGRGGRTSCAPTRCTSCTPTWSRTRARRRTRSTS